MITRMTVRNLPLRFMRTTCPFYQAGLPPEQGSGDHGNEDLDHGQPQRVGGHGVIHVQPLEVHPEMARGVGQQAPGEGGKQRTGKPGVAHVGRQNGGGGQQEHCDRPPRHPRRGPEQSDGEREPASPLMPLPAGGAADVSGRQADFGAKESPSPQYRGFEQQGQQEPRRVKAPFQGFAIMIRGASLLTFRSW